MEANKVKFSGLGSLIVLSVKVRTAQGIPKLTSHLAILCGRRLGKMVELESMIYPWLVAYFGSVFGWVYF
jgi:hypothetical protein